MFPFFVIIEHEGINMSDNIKYRRVVLKLSGEALSGPSGSGFDFEIINNVSDQIKRVVEMGVEMCIILGGGNIWRGREGVSMDRATADYMGMLATTINALAVQDALEAKGIEVRVQTAIEMRQIAEPYIRRRAMHHLEKGRVVVFACGTGNPYFSSDTAAALRAAEMDAEMILLAKNVNGVYTSDPNIDSDAKKYASIAYIDVIKKGLKVMDSTAVSLCMDNKIPIIVFGLNEKDAIKEVLTGNDLGTRINDCETVLV